MKQIFNLQAISYKLSTNQLQLRKTGWSPICCRRRNLRRSAPSKILLLHGEIRDDNVANNGETFISFGSRIIHDNGPSVI